jgi:hypothetical protein
MFAAGKGAAAAAFTYRGIQYSQASGTSTTFSFDLGTAAADRYVVVGIAHQNNFVPTGVTAAGVTLTKHANKTSGYVPSIWGALVTAGSGSQNIVFDNGAFNARWAAVWTVTGLISTTPAATGIDTTGDVTLAVQAGDFLFGIATKLAGTPNYTGSTETLTVDPNATNTVGAGVYHTIAATNGSFLINGADSNNQLAYVLFR